MYIINDYQLVSAANNLYVSNDSKGAKISNKKLATILIKLQSQEKFEISEEQLSLLAEQHQVDLGQLKNCLINELQLLKPMLSRKFKLISINSDDDLIVDLLKQSLGHEYHLQIVPKNCFNFSPNSMVIFYRKNYSNADFKTLYQQLSKDVYLITAGVIHKLLVIDNLYYLGSGLPSHVANLQQLMAYLHSDIPATKNNWLLYYRNLVKQNIDSFPNPHLNACQQGYIAYCLFQFASQFTNLWKTPTPLDQLNWFWHVDLTDFNIHREVALHSPFSQYDMKLNMDNLVQQELG